MLFLAFLCVAFSAQVIWKTTTYSDFSAGCNGFVVPVYVDAAPDAACTPGVCFCSTGTGSSCRTTNCINVTVGQVPATPTNMVGFSGYSDSTCTTPTHFKAALPGCDTYGGGSVSSVCTGTQQLAFTTFPADAMCPANSPLMFTCNAPSNACTATADTNGVCGSYTKNTCGISPTQTTPTTTTGMATKQPAGASVLAVSFAFGLLLLVLSL
jgi:hypothetical protein